MTTQEKIEVMQAYEEGKQIQARLLYETIGMTGCYDVIKWEDVQTPTWNWDAWEYRIKPEPKEPKYRPYKDFAEFLADWKKHGGWVKDKRDGDIYLQIEFNETKPMILYCHKVWADDGTPCGVKEE